MYRVCSSTYRQDISSYERFLGSTAFALNYDLLKATICQIAQGTTRRPVKCSKALFALRATGSHMTTVWDWMRREVTEYSADDCIEEVHDNFLNMSQILKGVPMQITTNDPGERYD